MYRLIVESLLGLRLEVDKLYFNPCFPEEWERYNVDYRYRETIYNITLIRLHNTGADSGIIVDGVKSDKLFIPLKDDKQKHTVEIIV